MSEDSVSLSLSKRAAKNERKKEEVPKRHLLLLGSVPLLLAVADFLLRTIGAAAPVDLLDAMGVRFAVCLPANGELGWEPPTCSLEAAAAVAVSVVVVEVAAGFVIVSLRLTGCRMVV